MNNQTNSNNQTNNNQINNSFDRPLVIPMPHDLQQLRQVIDALQNLSVQIENRQERERQLINI